MRRSKEGLFKSWDGTELFYRTWEPTQPETSPKALILIHRGHEHSGRLQDIVDHLGLDSFWAFAFDARGHGRSPGPRGYARSLGHMVKDLETFIRMISKEKGIPIENISVIANSVGAVIASTWVHDYAPRIRSMVLAAPALKVKLYVPFALFGLRILNRIKHPAFISSYVKSKMLTHDLKEARRYDEDPLIARGIAVNILVELFDAAQRILSNAAAIVTPTLVLSAGRDFVVHLPTQKKFFERLGSKVKQMHVFPKFFHGVFYEKGKEEALAMARHFVLESFKKPVETGFLREAHKGSFSLKRYQELTRPIGFLRDLPFRVQRVFIQTLGKLSHGVKLGTETGFDSGMSLDYVYRNRPSGVGLFGKIIDFTYLNAVGWKGVRIRKIHLEKLLEQAIASLSAQGKPIRILDIAGGPGRYLIDTALRHRDKDLSIVIRDKHDGSLAEGRRIAQKAGLENVVHMRFDAFSGQASSDAFRPNIIVISGFFELFSNNDDIVAVLQSVRKTSDPSCKVIYTGQPWHPQQEMIARTLTNRDGKPWVMRLRTQAELDELFRLSGFEKAAMEIDSFGIFTVSLAERGPATSGAVADRRMLQAEAHAIEHRQEQSSNP